MQSEPTNTSQNTLSTELTQVTYQAIHHGLDYSRERPSRPLRPGEGGRETSTSAKHAGATSPPVASDGNASESAVRRLNSTSPRTPSPVDRIIEHERAVSYSPKRRNEGPRFTVVKGGKKSSNGQVALAEFPNGLQFSLLQLVTIAH